MKVLKFIILGLLVGNISCNNDDAVNPKNYSYLIFGHFYGECMGEGCVETFKLTDTQLFEDTNDNYFGENLNFIELEHSKFELVKDLKNAIPSQLLDDNTPIFGCPDCADGGGLFIQYSKNGKAQSWRIDKIKSHVPDYLHAFMDQVNANIALISN